MTEETMTSVDLANSLNNPVQRKKINLIRLLNPVTVNTECELPTPAYPIFSPEGVPQHNFHSFLGDDQNFLYGLAAARLAVDIWEFHAYALWPPELQGPRRRGYAERPRRLLDHILPYRENYTPKGTKELRRLERLVRTARNDRNWSGVPDIQQRAVRSAVRSIIELVWQGRSRIEYWNSERAVQYYVDAQIHHAMYLRGETRQVHDNCFEARFDRPSDLDPHNYGFLDNAIEKWKAEVRRMLPFRDATSAILGLGEAK